MKLLGTVPKGHHTNLEQVDRTMIMIIPSFTLSEWRPDRLAHMMPSQDTNASTIFDHNTCSGYYRKLIRHLLPMQR